MLDVLKQIVVDFWATVSAMSPYLLFGFFVAGLLSVLVSQKVVERHLGGGGLLPLLKATVFGIPLPLCSCGVIPVSMSLHKHGASRGSTVSFLLSTPQTGVDSILVTFSLLGPVFAVFRPLAALVTGLAGGLLVNAFGQKAGAPSKSEPCTDECCAAATPRRKIANGMKYAFVTLPRDIGKSMLVGLVLAAIISALVPEGFFAERLGRGIGAMLLMMVLGVPIYVCATASVPIAAALILKGLSPGAALVFLMTGPATNAAGLATLWHSLGRRTALLYLAAVAACALLAGVAMDFIVYEVNLPIATHTHQMLPPLVEHLAALALLALLAHALLTPKHH